MDGNYHRCLNQRMEKAELLLVYDLPRYQCLLGYLKRWLSNRGHTRSDMSEDCVEKLDFEFIHYILAFKQVDIQLLKEMFPHVAIEVFTSHKQANLWLNTLKRK